MGTRLYITSILLILLFQGFSQTEEQRKYGIPKFDDFRSFILSSGETESLSTKFHTKDIYSDIYLDSPDSILLNNGLSLRFRRRISGSEQNEVTYAFQLKSEMDSTNGIRMEVEEPQLFFYSIKNGDNWISLTSILDTIFQQLDSPLIQLDSERVDYASKLLESWIRFKAESAVAPFQKLIHLNIGSLEEIKSIKPVCFGKSTRYRSHIYADEDQSQQLKLDPNRLKINDTPAFFKNSSDLIWILESSMDYTEMVSINSDTPQMINIVEYEVENKHFSISQGTKVLDIFEDQLIEMFQANSKSDSKYKQSMVLFMKN